MYRQVLIIVLVIVAIAHNVEAKSKEKKKSRRELRLIKKASSKGYHCRYDLSF